MRGVELEEVRDAITSSFDPDEFDMFLEIKLDFDRRAEIADAGFKKVAYDVVRMFVQAGRDPYLVAAIAAARPLRRDLQALYRRYAEGLLDGAWIQKVQAEQLRVLEDYGLAPRVALQLG